MSRGRHGTMVSRPCVPCVMRRKEFGSEECLARQDMEGRL